MSAAMLPAPLTLSSVVDRAYPLSEAGAAIRYLAEGDPVGRVVLTSAAAAIDGTGQEPTTTVSTS